MAQPKPADKRDAVIADLYRALVICEKRFREDHRYIIADAVQGVIDKAEETKLIPIQQHDNKEKET